MPSEKSSKTHIAVDTLGHLLALYVRPANEQDRAQVQELAQQVQEVTGQSAEIAFVDQGYTGEAPALAAQTLGRGTQFCLGGPLSAFGARLRTLA